MYNRTEGGGRVLASFEFKSFRQGYMWEVPNIRFLRKEILLQRKG